MSGPSPSSAPPAPVPPFFHNTDGNRIQVFVEAGGILNRPRLIRNLKKHDAVICTDPKNAQVILVDPESWQGKEFVREWGKDRNKVVLHYSWVTKSINTGRPLLEGDDWGGSKTRDDGLPILRPIATGEEGVPVPKSPLPTPRETPMEAKKASSPKRRKSADAHQQRPSLDKLLSRIGVNPENTGSSSSTPPVPPPTLDSTQLSQPQPHSQSTPMISPAGTDPGSVFSQQQQAPSTIPLPLPNSLLPGFSPMNMMQFPPQMLAMFAQSQQQQAGPQSSMGTQPPSMLPQMQENFTTALMDIMKMHGTIPMGQWPMFPNMMAPMQQQMPQSANGSSGSGTFAREGSSGATTSRKATESPMLNSPSVLHTSIKRKRKSDAREPDSADDLPGTEDDDDSDDDEPPLATLYKKQKKDEDRALKHKRKGKEGRARRSSMQFTVPARNPHASKAMSSGDSSEKLFVHPDKKPMQFFVQVDQNNRQEVTRAIKKYGGIITSQIPGADYAVLYTLSTTFKNLLNEATVTKTPAVTHHFVLDAINQGSIPSDLDNYLFDAKQSFAARRKRFSSAAEAEEKRLEKNAKQSERVKQENDRKYTYVARSGTPESCSPSALASASSTSTINKATSATSKPKPSKITEKTKGKTKETKELKRTPGLDEKPLVGSSTSVAASASTSPAKKSGYYPKETTPPPPTKAEKWAQGYLYTPEEKEWAEKYLFIMFKRNPLASQTLISKSLHRKLPHHTQASWGTFLAGAFKSQYEETRKRGGIAHRKEKSRWEAEQEKLKPEREEVKKEEGSRLEGDYQKVPLPSEGGTAQTPLKQDEKMKEEKEKEKEKQQERAEEKEIEDHVMEDIRVPEKQEVVEGKEKENRVSPMQVDGPTQVGEVASTTTMEVTKGAPEAVEYTQEEERDMATVVQFFLDGGDQGEEEDVIWQKLAQKTEHKTATEWTDFFTKHDKEIVARYGKLLKEAGVE